MSESNYPSPIAAHRRADQIVHAVGFVAIVLGGALLLGRLEGAALAAAFVYALCILASNLASMAYHFLPRPAWRVRLRRVDHAMIYFSIVGTFTPVFVAFGGRMTFVLLVLCWALALAGAAHKVFGAQVKSRWSTASYLALGALGLMAFPTLHGVPRATVLFVLGGAVAYVIGSAVYSRKTIPYRYAIWHVFVNLGGMLMFLGIWCAL